MRTAFGRWCLITAASALYSFLVAGGVFWGSLIGNLAAAYGPPYYAMLWAANDARRTRYWPAYHYGLLLFLLSYVAVPHYVLRTRGRSGRLLAFGALVLLALPPVASVLGWSLYAYLPDFRE